MLRLSTRLARSAARRGRMSTAVAATPYDTHVVEDELIQENGGLMECAAAYSVVYTDRALNHMSEPFQHVMTDLHASLTAAYNADHAVLLPGSGTYAMEAAARAFGVGNVVVVRNGYFSYRWTQLFQSMGKPDDQVTVLKAAPAEGWAAGEDRGVSPPPVEDVVATIRAKRPSMVCAPHVETSAGIILPEAYMRAIGDACAEVGATFCLDGVASGTAWVDMKDLGVGAYITAPQKGWTGPACVGVCMLSDAAAAHAEAAPVSSFSIDLHKWRMVMGAYLDGGHMYHATMPTDAIRMFRDVVKETERHGLAACEAAAWKLGFGVRDALKARGFTSVAAEGVEAPGVAVVYANDDPTYAGRFKNVNLQIAAGVPLVLGEPDNYNSFRIGLFGLDKLMNVDRTVSNFEIALDAVLAKQ
ncbi:serine-pyruvate transaminase [Aureococcus anophagefferens]|uniref:Serine-pyruvate transaminase n=1 Tax=Aureococcus anophagefferens TaxID=44056 RepID=A0ABR1FUI3_AURAN